MSEAIFPKVEIVEYVNASHDPEKGGHVASALRINGIEFHAPVDSTITVTAGPEKLTAVTATFYVGEVSVVQKELVTTDYEEFTD